MAPAQIVRSPSSGLVRRTFKAKHWGVVVQQDENSRAELLIFVTKEEAERVNDSLYRDFRPEVHYVEQLEVLP